MRNQHGNGATCHLCLRSLEPMETFRITGFVTLPGKNYDKVSSDTTTKNLHKFHLCEECYNRVIQRLTNKTI